MTIAWSYSRLNKFRQCQLKSFWMDYAPKAMKVVEPPSPIFEKGQRMHKAMENALKRGAPLPSDLKVPNGTGKEESVNLTALEPIVAAIRNSDQMWVERQLAFTEDLRDTSWFAKDVWCRVIWDAAGKEGNKINMVDWKSGKPRPDSDQLELFAASVFQANPDTEEVHTFFVFLEHAKYTHDVFYRSSLAHIWQKFGEEAERIELAQETGNWEPCPGYHCKWCPVPKSKCSHSQVEG
jgi:hypothetical protein